MTETDFKQRLADIAQHVADGLITKAEGRRQSALLRQAFAQTQEARK